MDKVIQIFNRDREWAPLMMIGSDFSTETKRNTVKISGKILNLVDSLLSECWIEALNFEAESMGNNKSKLGVAVEISTRRTKTFNDPFFSSIPSAEQLLAQFGKPFEEGVLENGKVIKGEISEIVPLARVGRFAKYLVYFTFSTRELKFKNVPIFRPLFRF